jgi:hypothetical protein
MRRRALLLLIALAIASPPSSARAEPPGPAAPPVSEEELDAIVGRIPDSKAAEDAAVATLRRYGVAAAPALIRGLRHPSEAVRRSCAGLLSATPDIAPTAQTLDAAYSLLLVKEAFVRLAAARIVLKAHGEHARVTAMQALSAESPGDDLLALLRPTLADPSPFVRREAVAAVARIGPVVVALVPDLLRLLDTSGVEDRVRIVRAAAATRPGRDDLVPLADRFGTETREVRTEVLIALSTGDPLGEGTALVVHRGLADPEAGVRIAALGAIGGGVPASADMRATVVDRLGDPNSGVAAAASKLIHGLRGGVERLWLAEVLAWVERDPTGAKARSVLQSWVPSSGEQYVALLATAGPVSTRELLRALASASPETAERLAPAVRKALPSVLRRTDLDEETLQQALSVYERIGSRTEEGLAATLIPLLAGPDGPLRRGLVRRLQSNAPAQRLAVKMLSDADPRARDGALALLGALPHLDPASQEAVANLLFEKDRDVVTQALRALLPQAVREPGAQASGPLTRFDSTIVFEALRAALRDDDTATKWRAAGVLGAMGRPSLPAMDDLRALLLDLSRDVAVAAARAIDRIARASDTSARDVMADDLASEDTGRVAAALLVLAEAGGYTPIVLPPLDEILTVADARTLIPALRAAARLGPQGRPLEARLLALRDHSDRAVVQAALEALKAIHSR